MKGEPSIAASIPSVQVRVSPAVRAGLRSTDVVLDLFCGTGAISLSLAGCCKAVIGIESSASAVADAKHNADRNGIANASFWRADLGSSPAVATVAAQLPAIDVVVAGAGLSATHMLA